MNYFHLLICQSLTSEQVSTDSIRTSSISYLNESDKFYSNFNFDRASNSCSLDFDSLNVKIYSGDITESTSEVIFNPTSSNLDLGGNVSKALLGKGGPTLLNEIDSFRKSFSHGFCFTGVGLLKCKALIHVDVRKFDTVGSVINALKAASEKKYTSLVLPVIGTGMIKSGPENSIREMIDGITAFVVLMNRFGYAIHLKNVEICVHTKQSAFLQYFLQIFTGLDAKKSLDRSFQTTISKYLHMFDFPAKKTQVRVQADAQVFKLIADSKEKLSKVKDELERLAALEMVTEEIVNDYFDKMDHTSKVAIENICRKELVISKWEKSKLKFIGRQKNIAKSLNRIMQVVTSHAVKEKANMLAEMTALKVQWQYFDGGIWTAHNVYINSEIEQMYQSKVKIRDIMGPMNIIYIFNIEKMTQTDKSNPAHTFKLQRVNFDDLKIAINLPVSWEPNKHQDVVSLDVSSNEYTSALKRARDTGLPFKKIVSIQRIQNKRLFVQYQTQKELFEKKYAHNANEMTLFHGTSADCVQKIWVNGFNRNYAG